MTPPNEALPESEIVEAMARAACMARHATTLDADAAFKEYGDLYIKDAQSAFSIIRPMLAARDVRIAALQHIIMEVIRCYVGTGEQMKDLDAVKIAMPNILIDLLYQQIPKPTTGGQNE